MIISIMKTNIFFVIILVTFFVGMAMPAMLFFSVDASFDPDTTPTITTTGNYTVHHENVMWDEARRKCRNQSSILVEIDSNTKLTDIQNELISQDVDSAWVGGRGAQPGENPACGYFWNEEGEIISIPVKNKTSLQCIPGSDRTYLRVEVIQSAGEVELMARHKSSILPYICEYIDIPLI